MTASPPSVSAPPLVFDPARIARNRARAAASYEKYAFLKARVSSDIAERLDDTPRRFERGLDVGAHDGRLAADVIARGKAAHMVALEPAAEMVALARARGLETVLASPEALPFEPESFDLAVSALSLHWVNDLPGALIQIRRILKPDGLFLGALLGAGTLSELRSALMTAEIEQSGGAAMRVSPLPGLKDMASLMQRAGFALPVVDLDRVTVRYDDMAALLGDLKGMGERAAFAPGVSQVLPRRVLQRAEEIYERDFSDPDGRVRASFEVIHLSGWAPAPSQPKPLKRGSAKASLAAAIGAMKSKDP